MIRLYDNPFSPFTRKVRMVLAHKGLAFESIDALALDRQAALLAVNPRGEVPVLDDDGFIVVDSSDIVAYLEDRSPEPPVFPASARGRARARAWERFCDTIVDVLVHDASLWIWPTHRRSDAPPAGLLETARSHLLEVARVVEAALADGPFLCGAAVSVADFALFPHFSSLKPLGVSLSANEFSRALDWSRRMRALDVVKDDLATVRRLALERFGSGRSPYESQTVIWRGDRIEWLFANGFDEFWTAERSAGRAVVPRTHIVMPS